MGPLANKVWIPPVSLAGSAPRPCGHEDLNKILRPQVIGESDAAQEGSVRKQEQSGRRASPHECRRRGVLNACTKWQVRRQPRNSGERRAVRTQTGGRQAGRRQQIECTKLQLSRGARAEDSGVGFGAPADPMESRPSVRDVRAQGWQKGRPVERGVTITDLASKFLAQESDSAACFLP